MAVRFLTTRAAAGALGVHENTLRHWEERGIIRAIRLPGSNFRRYRPQDVDELSRQMHRQLARHDSDVIDPATPVVQGQHDASLWEQ